MILQRYKDNFQKSPDSNSNTATEFDKTIWRPFGTRRLHRNLSDVILRTHFSF